MKKQLDIIKENDLKLKKSLGQNFLKDTNIIKKIISVANVTIDDYVIEIGPGAGALTTYLVNEAKKLTCVEIDDDLIPYLTQEFSQYEKFNILHVDFLKTSQSDFDFKGYNKVKVVANLPYYITSAIISKILLEFNEIDEIYIMVQKEVAERITSLPKNKAYGSLSVFCQTMCDVNYEFTVSKNVFIPAPKIDSAIISLKRKNDINIDIYKYQVFIKNCFKQKRKTLVNNLYSAYGIEKSELINFLESQSLNSTIRSEHINIEDFKKLYNEFKNKYLKES